jgi:hypothetical protein
VAGCRDAYLADWDEEYSYMVCGEGPTQLVLTIEPDPRESGATGSIPLDSWACPSFRRGRRIGGLLRNS